MFYRAALHQKDLDLVAVNDITDARTLAHLLKYDSVHGVLPHAVKAEGDQIMLDGHAFKVLAERDPSKLPWKQLGVQVVVESTGLFTARDKAAMHLSAGARKVVISAPAEGADITLCLGVNQNTYEPKKHDIISNASCTTNCLAPIVKVLHESFGIVHGLMTTIHAYTQDQMLQDGPHKDLRRARAAALNLVPTSTGAARAIGVVMPDLKGKVDGMSMRAPVPTGSIVDLAVLVGKETTAEEVNEPFRSKADPGDLEGF